MDPFMKKALPQFSVEGIEGRQYECNLKPCDQTCTSLHTFKQHLERIHPTKFNVGIENIRQGRPIDFTGIKLTHNSFLISGHFPPLQSPLANSTKKLKKIPKMSDRKSWEKLFVLPQHYIDEIFKFLKRDEPTVESFWQSTVTTTTTTTFTTIKLDVSTFLHPQILVVYRQANQIVVTGTHRQNGSQLVEHWEIPTNIMHDTLLVIDHNWDQGGNHIFVHLRSAVSMSTVGQQQPQPSS